MATVQFSEIGNNGITQLNGAINNSTTSVIVDSVTALTLDTSTTLAYLTIIDASTWRKDPITNPEVSEIVKVTSISGNTCTVVRAQDGTTAKAFADNDIVELRNTAVVTTEIQNALTDGTQDLNISSLSMSGDIDLTKDGAVVNIGAGATGSTYALNVDGLANNHDSGLRVGRNGAVGDITIGCWTSGEIRYTPAGTKPFNIINTSANDLTLQTNSAVALTIDSGQDATFSGDVEVGGDLTLEGSLSLDSAVDKTISSGAITASGSYHKLSGEGGTADFLHTINGGVDGDILILRASSDAVDITVQSTSNIKLGASTRLLDSEFDSLTLQFMVGTTANRWIEIAYTSVV